MEQIGTNQRVIQTHENNEATQLPIIMVVFGILGVLFSPVIAIAIGIIPDDLVVIALIISLVFGGISEYVGGKIRKNGQKIGIVGTIFAILVVLLIIIPILYVWATPSKVESVIKIML
jgi:hypothetical protein